MRLAFNYCAIYIAKEYRFVVVDEDTLTIEGELKYWRYGGKEGESGVDINDLGFVDPSGGPFLAVGDQIEGRTISKISVDSERILFKVES